jgi:ribosomal-protein-alanine N-acetyltransferase
MVMSEAPEEAAPPAGGFWGSIRRIVSTDAPPAPSERILGFIGVWLMMGEAHIVTVAVRSTHRRNGIGERLLIECIDMAMAEEQESVTLEVRKSNEAAQALYYKYGFARVGLRLRYYTDNQEDAVIMTTPDISGAGFLTQYQALKSRHQARYPELWA